MIGQRIGLLTSDLATIVFVITSSHVGVNEYGDEFKAQVAMQVGAL